MLCMMYLLFVVVSVHIRLPFLAVPFPSAQTEMEQYQYNNRDGYYAEIIQGRRASGGIIAPAYRSHDHEVDGQHERNESRALYLFHFSS